MSNDVALALQSWWQMPALPAAEDDDDDGGGGGGGGDGGDGGDGDEGLLRQGPGPASEPSPLGPRVGGGGAAHAGPSSRKKKDS
jgi:hypothetical protein